VAKGEDDLGGSREGARFRRPQQEAALRYAQDAERNLRQLRKAIKKGNLPNAAECLAAVQSDASRLATVLALAEHPGALRAADEV